MFLAEELLRRTTLTLAEIAKQCGFASEFSLSKAFKRAYNTPPILYRKTHSNKR
jgi:transcriptional regulator GlxA family with amidase domain